MLCTLLLVSCDNPKKFVLLKTCLWALQKLVYVSGLILIWSPMSEPGYGLFTCSFRWFVFVVCCFSTGYHLESFCSVWDDHSTHIPWHCPVGAIPVCLTTLQQSSWHLRYVLRFGVRPLKFMTIEILVENFTVNFLTGNATLCCLIGSSHSVDWITLSSRAVLMQTQKWELSHN